MTAASLDLTVEKYATFKLALQIKDGSGETATPADITGYTPRMQIRASATEPEIYLELNTTNGRIVVTDAATGLLAITLPASETASIGWTAAVYDLLLIGPSETRRIIQGKVVAHEGVTR